MKCRIYDLLNFASEESTHRATGVAQGNLNDYIGRLVRDEYDLEGTAESTEQKVGWIRDGAGDRFDELELEIAAYFTVVTDQRDATLAKMAPGMGLEPDALGTHPHGLIGSIDSICDQLVERRERFGISYVTFSGRAAASVVPVVERLAGT